MWTNTLYILFVIALSFGGNLHYGFLTPRQIVAVFMFFITLRNLNFLKPYYKTFFLLYSAYLFILFWASFFDGTLNNYCRSFISQHMVAMVSFGSFIVYYAKKRTFVPIFITFIVCGFLNSIVCLLQYSGNPLGFTIGSLFISETDVMANNHMEHLMEGTGTYLLGMKGDAVHNGEFMMMMPFLLAYVRDKYKEAKQFNAIGNILYYCLLCLFFITILLIQERSCILLSIFFYILYLWKTLSKISISKKMLLAIILPFILLLGYLYVEPYILDYIVNSRFESQDNSTRKKLLHNSLEFIGNHFFMGSMNQFLRENSFRPHNILLNAFVETGFFGFIMALILYFKQIRSACKLALLKDTSVIVFAFITCTSNSLFHNDSILTGDVYIWVLWGCLLCYKYEKYSKGSKLKYKKK